MQGVTFDGYSLGSVSGLSGFCISIFGKVLSLRDYAACVFIYHGCLSPGFVVQISFGDLCHHNCYKRQADSNSLRCQVFTPLFWLIRQYRLKNNEKISQFFDNFDDCISEEEMWRISESIKPRGRAKK